VRTLLLSAVPASRVFAAPPVERDLLQLRLRPRSRDSPSGVADRWGLLASTRIHRRRIGPRTPSMTAETSSSAATPAVGSASRSVSPSRSSTTQPRCRTWICPARTMCPAANRTAGIIARHSSSTVLKRRATSEGQIVPLRPSARALMVSWRAAIARYHRSVERVCFGCRNNPPLFTTPTPNSVACARWASCTQQVRQEASRCSLHWVPRLWPQPQAQAAWRANRF
jgi:hypothetical protein